MTAPLREEIAARIRQLAEAGQGRNAIARDCGVSVSTVSKVCKAAGIAFDRSATAAATEAAMIDAKAQRARLADRVLMKAHALIDAMDEPHEITSWDRDGVLRRATIDKPTAADVQRYMIAVGIATDKHLALVRQDADPMDLPAVDKWLAFVTGADASQ